MKTRDQFVIFEEMIAGLQQAIGGASHMIHHAGHPTEFMIIRHALELTMDGCNKVAPHNIFIQPKLVIV